MTRFKKDYNEPSYLNPFRPEPTSDYQKMALEILEGRTTKQD